MLKYVEMLVIAVFLIGVVACGKDTPEAHRERLKKYIDEENFEKAEKELRVLLPSRPSDRQLLMYGAKIFIGLDSLDSAGAYAKKLAALYPKDLPTQRFAASVFELSRDFETQLRVVANIGDLEGSRVPYFLKIAELNFETGMYGMAKIVCDTILKYNPDSVDVLFLKANALSAAGQLDSAIATMERVDNLSPNRLEVLINLASFYASNRNYPQAEYYFSRVTFLFPKQPEGWFGLGNVLLKEEDTTRAIDAYRRAAQINPGFLSVDSILQSLKIPGGQ